nr:DEAD/DEAH box helicase family protein [Afipia felis]
MEWNSLGGFGDVSTIHDILAEFREAAHSKRDMGDKFERLFANFLVTEPYYKDRFSHVWLWTEWPGRGNKPDTGIDLIAEERIGGGLCAIQCKFYDPDSTIQKADLNSFFATSGKKPFASRIVVTTTDNWSKNAEPLLDDERVPCIRIRLQDLEDSAVDWSKFSLSRPDKMKLREKRQPREHQKEAIKDVLAGLEEAERGKLIMACGTGKTFTALKIAEAYAADASKQTSGCILFLVPSIALLSQSLKEWTAESSLPMHALAVCSDTAVGKSAAEDTEDIRVQHQQGRPVLLRLWPAAFARIQDPFRCRPEKEVAAHPVRRKFLGFQQGGPRTGELAPELRNRGALSAVAGWRTAPRRGCTVPSAENGMGAQAGGRQVDRGQNHADLQQPHQPDRHPARGPGICRQRQACHRMGDRALPGDDRQGQRHRQRSERLGRRTRRSDLHLQPRQARRARERRDGAHREGAAGARPACM